MRPVSDVADRRDILLQRARNPSFSRHHVRISVTVHIFPPLPKPMAPGRSPPNPSNSAQSDGPFASGGQAAAIVSAIRKYQAEKMR